MQLPFYPGKAKNTNFRVDIDGLLIEGVQLFNCTAFI